MLSLPSPFACPFTENLHISQVCSYVVYREQKGRLLSDWVLSVCVVCVYVCVCACVCVHARVHTREPFLLMEHVSLLFLFFLKFDYCHSITTIPQLQPPPPYRHTSTTTTDHCHTVLVCKWSMCISGWKEKDHQRKLQQVAPPPVQGVFVPMADGKMPPAQVAASDHHHVCKWSTIYIYNYHGISNSPRLLASLRSPLSNQGICTFKMQAASLGMSKSAWQDREGLHGGELSLAVMLSSYTEVHLVVYT